MKTLSTHPRVAGDKPSIDRASKLLVLCSAIALCIVSGTTADAQSPTASSGSGITNGSGVTNGLFTHGGEAFRVVNTAGFKTAADIGSPDPATVAQVGHVGACNSCGTSCGGACGGAAMVDFGYGNCGSCGTACGGRCGGRVSNLTCGPKFANPCQPCSPYRYGMIEALYMERDDDNFNFSGLSRLDDFDYEFGSRITFGAVTDCIHGYEASFVGPFDWDSSSRLAGPVTFEPVFATGNFVPVGSGTSVLANFREDTTLNAGAQRLESEYFSFDASKTITGWEYAKLLFGGRYVNYDEEFSTAGQLTTLQTRDPILAGPATETTTTTSNVALRNEIENRLIGLQIGLDLLYPISRNAFTDVRMRAGAYANFAELDYRQRGSQTVVSNPVGFADRTTSLNRSCGDDDVELAGLFELGSGVRYQVGEILSVRAGAELWYLSGIATATDGIGRLQSQVTNPNIKADDDVLFTGLSVGAELRY